MCLEGISYSRSNELGVRNVPPEHSLPFRENRAVLKSYDKGMLRQRSSEISHLSPRKIMVKTFDAKEVRSRPEGWCRLLIALQVSYFVSFHFASFFTFPLHFSSGVQTRPYHIWQNNSRGDHLPAWSLPWTREKARREQSSRRAIQPCSNAPSRVKPSKSLFAGSQADGTLTFHFDHPYHYPRRGCGQLASHG